MNFPTMFVKGFKSNFLVKEDEFNQEGYVPPKYNEHLNDVRRNEYSVRSGIREENMKETNLSFLFSSGYQNTATGWRQNINKISTQTEISNWVTNSNFPTTITQASVLISTNKVYILGGLLNPTYTYYATINDDGTLSSWTRGTNLSVGNRLHTSFITKSYAYSLGSVSSTVIQVAPINEDGTLGTWSTSSKVLAEASWLSSCIVIGNYVYLIGTGTKLQRTMINSDGTIGDWEIVTTLPIDCEGGTLVSLENKLYIFGKSLTVIQATINIDGTLSSFSNSITLAKTPSSGSIICNKNNIFILGGLQGSTPYTECYRIPINSDNSLGSPVLLSGVVNSPRLSCTFITKTRLYKIGGQEYTSGESNKIYYTLFEGWTGEDLEVIGISKEGTMSGIISIQKNNSINNIPPRYLKDNGSYYKFNVQQYENDFSLSVLGTETITIKYLGDQL